NVSTNCWEIAFPPDVAPLFPPTPTSVVPASELDSKSYALSSADWTSCPSASVRSDRTSVPLTSPGPEEVSESVGATGLDKSDFVSLADSIELASVEASEDCVPDV